MSVHRLQADALSDPARFYYACSLADCGWCGPLRNTSEKARDDGTDHWVAKSKAAERS